MNYSIAKLQVSFRWFFFFFFLTAQQKTFEKFPSQVRKLPFPSLSLSIGMGVSQCVQIQVQPPPFPSTSPSMCRMMELRVSTASLQTGGTHGTAVINQIKVERISSSILCLLLDGAVKCYVSSFKAFGILCALCRALQSTCT